MPGQYVQTLLKQRNDESLALELMRVAADNWEAANTTDADRIGVINFDGADPAFEPFTAGMRLIQGLMAQAAANPEFARILLGKYSSPVELYSFGRDIGDVYEYLEEIGVNPPGGEFSQYNTIVGLGGNGLYNQILRAVLEPGDVVLFPGPSYGLFHDRVLENGAEAHIVATRKEDGWKLRAEALQAKIDELRDQGKRVKMFVHINPSNPAGVIYDRQDMAELVPILRRHVEYVIDDTAYYGLELSNKKPAPVAGFNGMEEQTITIVTPSKAFACIGARCALAVAHPQIIGRMNNLAVDMSEGIPVFSAAYLIGTYSKTYEAERREYLQANREDYTSRRDLAYTMITGWRRLNPEMKENVTAIVGSWMDEPAFREKLSIIKELSTNGLREVKCTHLPEAGYYHILDFTAYRGKFFGRQKLETSLDLAKVLAQDAGIMVIPGQMSLFPKEELVVRISYALAPATVAEGLHRINNTLQKLRDVPNTQVELIWPPREAGRAAER